MKATTAAAIVAAIVLGGYIMSTREPRGIRNNNPLNIRKGNDWLGEQVGDDGEFEKFESPEYGYRAAARIFISYGRRRIDTLREIVSTWAPPVENNTETYVAFVAKQTGLDPDQPVPWSRWADMFEAMTILENGYNPYSRATIEKGLALAGVQ